jgi:HlyD family secretion protein
MSVQIFRKAALDRIASPEQLDLACGIVDMRARVALGGLLLAAIAIIGWGFAGTIPTEASGQGLLVTQGGRVLPAMASATGTLAGVRVAVGDRVEQGQPLASLSQPETELALGNARAQLAEKQAELERRTQGLAGEADIRQRNLDQRRSALNQAANSAQSRIRFLEQQLTGRRDLLKQGYVTAAQVQEAQQALEEAQRTLAENRAEQISLDAQSAQMNMEQERERTQLDAGIADLKRRIGELELQLQTTSVVRAPASGRVTEVKVGQGTLVSAGTPIVNVETTGQSLQAVLYIPTADGKRVAPGMEVRIAPAMVKKEEFGTLLGRVSSISAYPATEGGMAAVVQNEGLVRDFTKKGAPYEARVDLIAADSPSGFRWTSGQGPDIALTSGTLVAAEITVRRQRPVELVLPFFRKLLGTEP